MNGRPPAWFPSLPWTTCLLEQRWPVRSRMTAGRTLPSSAPLPICPSWSLLLLQGEGDHIGCALVQNLPLTSMWKLRFSIRTSNQCQQEVLHNLGISSVHGLWSLISNHFSWGIKNKMKMKSNYLLKVQILQERARSRARKGTKLGISFYDTLFLCSVDMIYVDDVTAFKLQYWYHVCEGPWLLIARYLTHLWRRFESRCNRSTRIGI